MHLNRVILQRGYTKVVAGSKWRSRQPVEDIAPHGSSIVRVELPGFHGVVSRLGILKADRAER